MVPWQRSHSHLLNNDDKRRNKQNLSKKMNVDSQRFSFYNEKRPLIPSLLALLNGSQHSTSLSHKNFSSGEVNPICRSCLTHPCTRPSADLYAHSHAKARRLVHKFGTHKQIHPGVPQPWTSHCLCSTFRCSHCSSLGGGLSVSLQFCGMRHWIMRSSGQIMLSSHKSVKNILILSIHWLKNATPARGRSRCAWTSDTLHGILSKGTLGEANDAQCAAPV